MKQAFTDTLTLVTLRLTHLHGSQKRPCSLCFSRQPLLGTLLLFTLGWTPGHISANSVTAKWIMFIFQNKSRSIMAPREREIWKEKVQHEKRRYSLISSSKKLPIWSSGPLSFIYTHADLAERKGPTEEYLAAHFPALIQVPQALHLNLQTQHRTMILC